MKWYRRFLRTRRCRKKYGDACPHLERHSKRRSHARMSSGSTSPG